MLALTTRRNGCDATTLCQFISNEIKSKLALEVALEINNNSIRLVFFKLKRVSVAFLECTDYKL